MHLTGIIDAQAFRAKIMVVREALRHKPGQAPADAQLAALKSIELKLAEIADLLRKR